MHPEEPVVVERRATFLRAQLRCDMLEIVVQVFAHILAFVEWVRLTGGREILLGARVEKSAHDIHHALPRSFLEDVVGQVARLQLGEDRTARLLVH